jgi:hypothetical protein
MSGILVRLFLMVPLVTFVSSASVDVTPKGEYAKHKRRVLSHSHSENITCPKGEYMNNYARRFLHMRPLAKVLESPAPANPTETPRDAIFANSHVNDGNVDATGLELPPVYYVAHPNDPSDTKSSPSNTFEELHNIRGLETKWFASAVPEQMHIHWEEPPPVQPVPSIPLYWINLNQGDIRSESVESQIVSLRWAAPTTRVQAFDGRSGGYDLVRTLTRKGTNICNSV